VKDGGGIEVNCPFGRVGTEGVVIDHDLVYEQFDWYSVIRRTPADHPETAFG